MTCTQLAAAQYRVEAVK